MTLLQAIAKKELLISMLDTNKVGLASMMFIKKDFIVWFEKYKSKSSTFSITIAAKIMGINQEITYQLVNEGILKSIIIGDKKLRVITEECISQFNNNYILLSKLSKKAVLSSRSLMSYLASKEIYPIDHANKLKFRQKVYNKHDLINVGILADAIE